MEYLDMDRVLMIVGDTTIRGSTRLQKYGFLLYKQYGRELHHISHDCTALKFYKDWEPYWYGPFSKGLRDDVDVCVSEGLVYKETVDSNRNSYWYALTIQGRVRWHHMMDEFRPEMKAIRKKIMALQEVRLERLLEGVYNAYPDYTKRSTIKHRF